MADQTSGVTEEAQIAVLQGVVRGEDAWSAYQAVDPRMYAWDDASAAFESTLAYFKDDNGEWHWIPTREGEAFLRARRAMPPLEGSQRLNYRLRKLQFERSQIWIGQTVGEIRQRLNNRLVEFSGAVGKCYESPQKVARAIRLSARKVGVQETGRVLRTAPESFGRIRGKKRLGLRGPVRLVSETIAKSWSTEFEVKMAEGLRDLQRARRLDREISGVREHVERLRRRPALKVVENRIARLKNGLRTYQARLDGSSVPGRRMKRMGTKLARLGKSVPERALVSALTKPQVELLHRITSQAMRAGLGRSVGAVSGLSQGS